MKSRLYKVIYLIAAELIQFLFEETDGLANTGTFPVPWGLSLYYMILNDLSFVQCLQYRHRKEGDLYLVRQKVRVWRSGW